MPIRGSVAVEINREGVNSRPLFGLQHFVRGSRLDDTFQNIFSTFYLQIATYTNKPATYREPRIFLTKTFKTNSYIKSNRDSTANFIKGGASMHVVHLDFETSSPEDLKTAGPYRYARDPDTVIICQSNDPSIIPGSGLIELNAHNVEFEMAVLEAKSPSVYKRITKVVCTAARAAMLGLPRSLKEVAKALGLKNQKDMEGHKVMLKYSKFKRGKSKTVGAIDLNKIQAYCDQDVAVEKELDAFLPPLPAKEQQLFELTLKINRLGVPIDFDTVKAIQRKVSEKNDILLKAIDENTGISGRDLSRRDFILDHLKSLGVNLPDLKKETVEKAVADSRLIGEARLILETKLLVGKSSLKKFEAMEARIESDGRIRGNLLYHGASTGRWSAKGVQLQNIPRGQIDNKAYTDIYRLSLSDFEKKYGDIHSAAQRMIRGCICAPHGKELLVFDLGQIEARVITWLADDFDLLEEFRTGRDVYKVMASKLLAKPYSSITKDDRQLGKLTTLALGYGMGWEKLIDTAKGYGLQMDEFEARDLVKLYRRQNTAITGFWKQCEWAMSDAIDHRGRAFRLSNNRLKFGYCNNADFLKVFLPSGRALYFYKPRITSRGISYLGRNKSGGLDRASGKLYGGKIAENIVQAVARDIMAEEMLKLETEGFKIILTVHDEVLCEEDIDADRFDEMKQIMLEVPDWAEGLPLAVEGYQAKRYRK